MSEYDIQKQIVDTLRMMGYYLYSTPNELLGRVRGGGGYQRMQRATQSGLVSGVADLTVVLPGRVVFLETKTAKGRQSERQREFERRVTELGHRYVVVRSVEDAIKALDMDGPNGV